LSPSLTTLNGFLQGTETRAHVAGGVENALRVGDAGEPGRKADLDPPAHDLWTSRQDQFARSQQIASSGFLVLKATVFMLPAR